MRQQEQFVVAHSRKHIVGRIAQVLHSFLIYILSHVKQLLNDFVKKVLATHKRRRLKKQAGESGKPTLLHLKRLGLAILGLAYYKVQLMGRIEFGILLTLMPYVLCKEHTVREMTAKIEHIVKLPLSQLLV